MEIQVRLTQVDCVSEATEIIAEGRAVLHGHTLIYAESKHPEIYHEVTFGRQKILLRRRSQYGSQVLLDRGGRGTARVKSPYGEMQLEAVLSAVDQQEDRWMVEYQLLDDSHAVVTHQRMIWELTGISDS